MLKPFSYKQGLLSISLLLASAPTMATPLGTADMFNAYGLSGFNYENVDIEGVIGSAGNITYTKGDTGREAGSTPYTVYGGGDVTITDHHVYNGGIQAGGKITVSGSGIDGGISTKDSADLTGGNYNNETIISEKDTTLRSTTFTNGTVHVGGNFDNENGGTFTGSTLFKGPGATTTADGWYLNQGTVVDGAAPNVELIDHAQISADIKSASDNYAAQTANGTVTNPFSEQWVFSGGSDLNIFDFDGSDLAHLSVLTFEGARDATYVFNVSGENIDFGSLGDKIGGWFYFADQMNVSLFDDLSSKILFNFYEATSVDIYGSVFGSILAPLADVYVYGGDLGGAINGSVYANNLAGYGQINNIAFTGMDVPPSRGQVPIPATLWLMGLGMIALLRQQTQRRKTTASS